MLKRDRRPWITLGVSMLLMIVAVMALAGSMKPGTNHSAAPLREAGSVVGTDLTIVPPAATTPAPSSEPAPAFSLAELRYLQLLHDQDEFEPQYAADDVMVVIGEGMCWRIDAGQTVPELIDYLDNRGYTYLAAAWIVGSALQELCVPAGER